MNDPKRLRDDEMNPKGEQPTNNLLKPNETILIQAIKSANPPHNQRALALLALDEGLSLVDSAQRSGLTPRQVRYWRNRFQEKGIAIFPPDIVETVEADDQPPNEQPEIDKPKKSKKSKQGKKSKDKKGKKMAKNKDKKKQKDKKSKKGKKGK